VSFYSLFAIRYSLSVRKKKDDEKGRVDKRRGDEQDRVQVVPAPCMRAPCRRGRGDAKNRKGKKQNHNRDDGGGLIALAREIHRTDRHIQRRRKEDGIDRRPEPDQRADFHTVSTSPVPAIIPYKVESV